MKETIPLVRFVDAAFAWPDPESEKILQNPDGSLARPIFDAFTADIPQGFISLVGPNGSGKSTFMLLAGARIMPVAGKIELFGHDSRVISGAWKNESGAKGEGLTEEIEHKRNLLCSFIYQNMEFEEIPGDERTVGSLLDFVYEHGGHSNKTSDFMEEVKQAMELEPLLQRKLHALSKGEMQRLLLGFSALYGSRVIMMDEPIFALEQRQKEKVLDFFKNLHKKTGVSVMVSLHELSLTKKYADTVMLFYPDRRIDLGSVEEVLTKEALEDAYGVPEAMMYDAERLTQKTLLERFEIGSI